MISNVTVIKVGGSLFASSSGLGRAAAWMNERSQHSPWVVITGGGIWADRIRDLDRTQNLSAGVAHRLALRAMSLTSWILAQLLDCPHFATWDELRAWQPSLATCCVFDAFQFCEEIEPGSDIPTLPIGWQVTSDSIAARLAVALNAEELILLKSTLPDCRDVVGATAEGYVDNFFPRAAEHLKRIRCVDLGPSGQSAECFLSRERI